jgi:2-oxoisovalerate dehydrogenase E1 component
VPTDAFFHNLLCTAQSQSAGRQMSPFMSDASRRILSQNVPVGNHALQAVGIAAELERRAEPGPARPIVVCGLGDGMTQQGEVLEAMGEASRAGLPVLFLVEDNGYAISTRTAGNTFFSLKGAPTPPDSCFGIPIRRLDGRDPATVLGPLAGIVAEIRESGSPAIVILEVERLSNHTNADNEAVYRTPEERAEALRRGDPRENLRRRLLFHGVEERILAEVDEQSRSQVEAAAEKALQADSPEVVRSARAELAGEPEESDPCADEPSRTMLEAVREVLRQRLEADERVVLLGEDIEDPKGDVFGVTRGLSTAFPGRVLNTALSESLIVGSAIGRALAGGRPVAFIQFADFLPQAFNQIHAELGSIFWRSAGGWSCPVIVMVACGGYRPGLGPFHSQTFESILAHVPGIDVVMPSTAADAAGLLQSAFESPRPTVILYPKVCLNDRDRSASVAIARHRTPLGRARKLREGDDLTLVCWGSTVPVCERVVDLLGRAGSPAGVDLLDLRSISPWDRAAVVESVRRTRNLVVVHEDNQTCGFGAEVAAEVVEAVEGPIRVRRVTRPDTYVPCNYANQVEVLPSPRRVLEAIAELLALEVAWDDRIEPPGNESCLIVRAVGSSPADQTIRIVEWKVAVGDRVATGQFVAELEADKALYPCSSPTAGTVRSLLAAEGQSVRPGTPILELGLEGPAVRRQRAPVERPPLSIIRKQSPASRPSRQPSLSVIQLGRIAVAQGSRVVTNEELIGRFPGRTPEDITTRTGIVSRRWLDEGESITDLAIAAAGSALEGEGLSVSDLDGLICCTTTPPAVTPSLACTILNALCKGTKARELPAFDLFAACTGYLYALSHAFDALQARPESRFLIVTAEGMSRLPDPGDFDTMILFGDAATATVVSGPGVESRPFARARRPLVSARGEPGKILSVPLRGDGHFRMEGLRVYAEAVRCMSSMLQKACQAEGMGVEDLTLIVPHQANLKIMTNLAQWFKLPEDRVASIIADSGNTSSSSIPLCLAEYHRRGRIPPGTVGLTAFGGGLTFGAALLDVGP